MEFVNINKKPRPHLHCGENIQGKMGQVFLVDNLFGELKTQTQKEKARKNLGISEALSSDAKIYWVDILGEPEVESPDIDDNSQRIATTEWVLEKIKDLSVAEEYLNISASPSQAFKGTENAVVIKWVTNKKITVQSLNGEELDPEVREYKTTTKDSTTFQLVYSTEMETSTASCSIQYVYPIYYGTQTDYSELSMTASSSFTIDVKDNAYAYVFTTKQNPKFYVGGFEGGFELIDTLSINGATYYKYKSENHSLGSILIEIK